MGLLAAIKALFERGCPGPPDERQLDGGSESALARSIEGLPAGERGWISFAEARSLFSTMEGQYAFGEMDDDGKGKIESFAAAHSSRLAFMPTEQRVYFMRQANR
jgi:hypothetical protein